MSDEHQNWLHRLPLVLPWWFHTLTLSKPTKETSSGGDDDDDADGSGSSSDDEMTTS